MPPSFILRPASAPPPVPLCELPMLPLVDELPPVPEELPDVEEPPLEPEEPEAPIEGS